MNAGHIHVAFTASEIDDAVPAAGHVGLPRLGPCPHRSPGWGTNLAIALNTWSGIGLDGTPDTWMLMDGAYTGGGAGDDRDGLDMGGSPVGFPQPAQVPDIEILESWYPILFDRAPRSGPGVNGAGRPAPGAATT